MRQPVAAVEADPQAVPEPDATALEQLGRGESDRLARNPPGGLRVV
jgi:hypothetical protein